MNRADLIALASPPCHECGQAVTRVETRWELNGDGDWVLGPTYMVCADGHRVAVELLPAP